MEKKEVNWKKYELECTHHANSTKAEMPIRIHHAFRKKDEDYTKISSLIEISSRNFNCMNSVAWKSKTIKIQLTKLSTDRILLPASRQGVEYSNSLFAGNKTDITFINFCFFATQSLHL